MLSALAPLSPPAPTVALAHFGPRRAPVVPVPEPEAVFDIPEEDQAEFYGPDLSDIQRAEVRALLTRLRRVHQCTGPRTKAMKAEASRINVSWQSVRDTYYGFRNSGWDWRFLINGSKAGGGRDDGLPPAFRTECARRFVRNQRKDKPAHRALLAQWQRWRRTGDPKEAIPGYRTAPEPDANGRHPAGWSYRNLIRHRAPKAVATIARVGTAAATLHLPCLPGTRAGARYLEFVLFDDVWPDRKVCVKGILDPCRLLQIGCLDYASGYYLKFGLRPELPATKAKGRERLKWTDMLELVAAFLAHYGYPLDYPMHLIVERGTATLRAADAKALFDYTGGRIIVCYTSMQGQLVAAWDEAKVGNPRGKAALESWHNLLHNESAALAGQMGKDRDHQPAALPGREREAHQLNVIAGVLTPEQRAELRLPFPSMDEAHRQQLEIVDRINRRDDHACEGFGVTTWWRLKGSGMDWQPEGALANVDPALLTIPGALEYDQRPESPLQRLQRLSVGVRMGQVPGVLLRSFLEDRRVVATIEKAGFRFQVDGKSYEYLPPSPAEKLAEGTELIGHYAPDDMGVIHLTDGRGCFVGTWNRFGPFPRTATGKAEAQRVRAAYLADAVAAARHLLAPDIEEEVERMDGNLEIIARAGLIPAPETVTTLARLERHVTPVAEGLQSGMNARQEQRARRAGAERARETLTAVAGEALERRSRTTAADAEQTNQTTQEQHTTYYGTSQPAGNQPAELYDPYDV